MSPIDVVSKVKQTASLPISVNSWYRYGMTLLVDFVFIIEPRMTFTSIQAARERHRKLAY
jgi:hypothetical protein